MSQANQATVRGSHFLFRLRQRGDLATRERALRLYSDPELVGTILNQISAAVTPEAAGEVPVSERAQPGSRRLALVPQREERVAIALAPGVDPPTVIVSRSGYFVTCLGTGMQTWAVPLVPWERAQEYLRVDDAHDAFKELKRDGSFERLLGTIHFAGFRLSREEFLPFRAAGPFLFRYWSGQMLSAHSEFVRSVQDAARVGALRPDDPRGTAVWRQYHALSHYLLLTATGGRSAAFSWLHPLPGQPDLFETFFQNVLSHGEFAVAARALFCIGQGEKHVFAKAKAALLKAEDGPHFRAAALSLLMVGARHRALAPSVVRALWETPAPREFHDDAVRAEASLIRDMAHWAMRTAEELSEAEVSGFRAWAGDWCRKNDPSGRLALFVDADGLTTLDFARRLLMNREGNLGDPDSLAAFLRAIPFLASMHAEDFFHPALEAPTLAHPYEFGEVDRLLHHHRARTPARSEKKPGRSDPCPCGSRKKHKKCCGMVG